MRNGATSGRTRRCEGGTAIIRPVYAAKFPVISLKVGNWPTEKRSSMTRNTAIQSSPHKFSAMDHHIWSFQTARDAMFRLFDRASSRNVQAVPALNRCDLESKTVRMGIGWTGRNSTKSRTFLYGCVWPVWHGGCASRSSRTCGSNRRRHYGAATCNRFSSLG